MESLCTRCARLQLRGGSQARNRAYLGIRGFTATSTCRDDDSSPIANSAGSGQSSSGSQKQENQQQRQPQQPLVRRQAYGPSGSPSGAQVLRRTGPPQQGQILRRTAGPPSAGGQLLRRTGAPGQPESGVLRRAPGQGQRPGGPQTGRLGAVGRGRPGQGKGQDPRRRRQRRNAGPDEESAMSKAKLEKDMDDYIKNYVDPPETPTKPLPYTPANLTLADLKPDWPDTPISASGLNESILRKIQWLAHRLPHGYQSPRTLAEHFLKGGLTRFESESEKKEVLKVAAELRDELAAAEPKTRDAPPPIASDVAFQDLLTKDGDKNYLVNATVKGVFGDLEKQKYPFLDNIVKSLRNNETYGEMQTGKFVQTITNLIPQQTRKGQPKKAA